MPTETQNLNLFKYDPVQDAKSTFNIQQSLNDNWDKIDNIIPVKANTSLDNLTDEGKKLITGYSFPSSTEYIDLSYNPTIYNTSYGAALRISKYKAPANGFLVIKIVTKADSVGLGINVLNIEPPLALLPNDSDILYCTRSLSSTGNEQGHELTVLAAKGQWIHICFHTGNTPYFFRFNYAQGEEL